MEPRGQAIAEVFDVKTSDTRTSAEHCFGRSLRLHRSPAPDRPHFESIADRQSVAGSRSGAKDRLGVAAQEIRYLYRYSKYAGVRDLARARPNGSGPSYGEGRRPRISCQIVTRSKCRYRWLRAPATTESESPVSLRDGVLRSQSTQPESAPGRHEARVKRRHRRAA